jgi:hypothetical protein
MFGAVRLMNSRAPFSFAPRPENDFPEFIETYYQRCREAHGMIEGNAGKWELGDLIPGLSDFDTRLFVRDGATIQDWSDISMAVGRVHLDLAEQFKDWARNLEHLPGINLTWSELLDPSNYSAEFSQWTFHLGNAGKLEEARRMAGSHLWNEEDERYHWKRIVAYYGRYDRRIDPPINLGRFENKYSLHSRLLHYFSPPLHSAVSLLERKTTAGKIDAFRRARSLFPHPQTIDLVLELIDGHYESPEFLTEPGMTELDDKLEMYLQAAVNTLLAEHAPFACPRNACAAELKAAGAPFLASPGRNGIFENARLARLMKGRLWFYTKKPEWFDSAPLIRNELNRIRSNFFEKPWQIFSYSITGKKLSVDESLEFTVSSGVISSKQAIACRRFAELADPQTPDHLLFLRAASIADIYDDFLSALESVSQAGKAVALV